MNEYHRAYLCLDSNILPEANLVRAIQSLEQYGTVGKISTAWESQSVGAEGPNYLNACVEFVAPFSRTQLKEQVLLPIEVKLGRTRTANKFTPRTIDIDIILFDDVSCDDKSWEKAFVVIPLAELYPSFQNPLRHEPLHETAERLRQETWMKARPAVLSRFHQNGSPISSCLGVASFGWSMHRYYHNVYMSSIR